MDGAPTARYAIHGDPITPAPTVVGVIHFCPRCRHRYRTLLFHCGRCGHQGKLIPEDTPMAKITHAEGVTDMSLTPDGEQVWEPDRDHSVEHTRPNDLDQQPEDVQQDEGEAPELPKDRDKAEVWRAWLAEYGVNEDWLTDPATTKPMLIDAAKGIADGSQTVDDNGNITPADEDEDVEDDDELEPDGDTEVEGADADTNTAPWPTHDQTLS